MKKSYLIKEARYYHKLNGFSRAFKKFLLTMTPMKNIVNSRTYNNYYSKVIDKKQKKIMPKILQVENTNICNAKCIMCPHNIMKRKVKTMTLEEFKKIVDNVLKDYKIEWLVITGFGEPFADKGIIEKIEYVNKKYPKVKIDIFTNASLLDKTMVDRLLGLKVDRMTFSINSTRTNYKKIVGLDYEKTKDNVLYLLKERKKRKNNILTNVSLMILKENEKDVEEFIKFWEKYADSVRVYPPSDWAGNVKVSYITKQAIKKKKWPCFVLWNNITIDTEGNVIMCCRDYESKVQFGNVLKEDIKDIRQGKKFQELLKKQLKCDFSTDVCNRCDNSFDSSLDWVC